MSGWLHDCSSTTLYNAAALGIDLSQIDRIVLSHGHRDHTGGLPSVLRQVRREIEVIAHPDMWVANYSGSFGERREEGELLPDPFWDDQAIIIKTKEGLAVITGCAHRGIINTLRHAQKLTGVKHIHTVIGGTHLFQAKLEHIDLTIAELKEFGIERIGVSHAMVWG